MQLRPYQLKGKEEVHSLWDRGLQNVCLVFPTGAGKTLTFASIVHEHHGPACIIAHRQELVQQISQALAREGVVHNIIGSKSVVTLCMRNHYEEFGKDFLNCRSKISVAGVDTLNIRLGRDDHLRRWAETCTLVIQDEAHHVLKENKWGNAASYFTNPNCKGLYVTATPTRADGLGLGRWADGVMDGMVIGPTMRELIDQGYLTDYRIFAPKSDLDMTGVGLAKDGDYKKPGVVKAFQKSHIVGDVVTHYAKIAMGKLAVAFVPSLEIADEQAAAFNAAGIPACAVSGKSTDKERNEAIRKFRNKEYLVLINVDLFGEGFDLPAIEVAIFARPTMSYSLYIQHFGRALRPLPGKDFAIIIDHVGNVLKHGLPDTAKNWMLDRRDKKGKSISDSIPTTVCPECIAVYERTHKVCPYCGYAPEPISRSSIEFVDGDLFELSPETLEAMRRAANEAVQHPDEFIAGMVAKGAKPEWALHHAKGHRERIEAQGELREAIAQWAGYEKHYGYEQYQSYRRFYFKFGIDILGAQALKSKNEINELKDKILLDYRL